MGFIKLREFPIFDLFHHFCIWPLVHYILTSLKDTPQSFAHENIYGFVNLLRFLSLMAPTQLY